MSGGGAERVAGLLSLLLVRYEYDVHIATVLDQISYSYGGTLHRLRYDEVLNKGKYSKIKKLLATAKYFKKQSFDIVVDFRMRTNFFKELYFRKKIFKDTIVIYTIHHFILDYYFPRPRWLIDLIYNSNSHSIAVSKGVELRVKDKIGIKNLKTIYNPVNQKEIVSALKEKPKIEGKYVLAVGRFNKVKQFDKLILAYSKSTLVNAGVKLILMGQGTERDLYAKNIDQYGLTDMVEILPFQENPYTFMKNAHFLVMSSKHEGFPMVLLESLTCGTPVVSFDCDSGPSEIIAHEQNGLLVDNQNFDALINAMNRFVEDKKLYDFCKTNAKESVAQFSMQEIALQWDSYLKKIL